MTKERTKTPVIRTMWTAVLVLTVAGVGRAHATSAAGRATYTGNAGRGTAAADVAATKYPGQVAWPKGGGYQLCIKGGRNFIIKGKRFSGTANAILLQNVSNVTITGNTFTNLSGAKGFAGVHIKNSTSIIVKDNRFTHLSNHGNMHGVYVVKSATITIAGNTFFDITGDAVRIRDGVNDIMVSDNKITSSGIYGIVSEWGRIDTGEESCGRNNLVMNNKYRATGNSGHPLALIQWGGWGGRDRPKYKTVTFGHCASPSITDGGGNKRI